MKSFLFRAAFEPGDKRGIVAPGWVDRRRLSTKQIWTTTPVAAPLAAPSVPKRTVCAITWRP